MESSGNNKKKKSSKPESKPLDKVTPLDRAQLDELLASSLKSYITRAKKQNKEFEDVIKVVDQHLSEFFQAFIVFGYDMTGHPMVIQRAVTQMDQDALNSLVSRMIFSKHTGSGDDKLI